MERRRRDARGPLLLALVAALAATAWLLLRPGAVAPGGAGSGARVPRAFPEGRLDGTTALPPGAAPAELGPDLAAEFPGGILDVLVVLPDGTMPAAHAVVRVCGGGADRRAVADEGGRVSFPGEAAKLVVVEARLEGRGTGRAVVPPPPAGEPASARSVTVRLEDHRVEGTVVAAADGSPVPGARVLLSWAGSTGVPGQAALDGTGAWPLGEATTAADGTYRASGPPPGSVVLVEASAKGFAAARAAVAMPGEGAARADLELERSRTVVVTVLDGAAPVAGAVVHLRSAVEDAAPGVFPEWGGWIGDGRTAALVLDDPGSARTARVVMPRIVTAGNTLATAGSVDEWTGGARSSTRFVEGGIGSPEFRSRGFTLKRTFADAAGRAVFEGVPADAIWFADARGRDATAPLLGRTGFHLPPGETPFEVVVAMTGSASVRVEWEGPVPEALHAHLQPCDGGEKLRSSAVNEGTVSWQGLVPGAWIVSVGAPGGLFSETRTVHLPPGGPTVVRFTAPETGSVEGFVEDDGGARVPAVALVLRRGAGGPWLTAFSDQEGAFAFHGVPAGPCEIRLRAPDVLAPPLRPLAEPTAPATGLRVVIPRRASLRARLVKVDGTEAAGTSVYLSADEGNGKMLVADANGRVHARRLEPGGGSLRVDGRLPVPYRLEPGEELDLGDIVLDAPGAAAPGTAIPSTRSGFFGRTAFPGAAPATLPGRAGSLRYADGAPASGGSVAAANGAKSVVTHGGTFVCPLPAGEEGTLVVTAPGFPPFERAVGRDESPVDLVLPAHAEVRVTVRDGAGAPVPGFRVVCEAAGAEEPVARTTDAAGRAVLRVAPGACVLRVPGAGPREVVASGTTRVEVAVGR